ncbi:Glucanosyltransferase-domain-containing protein [Trichophaea hybrida]|nr:Glucanosyltransferase-domain-containing protein [Trichophaea hybrida]
MKYPLAVAVAATVVNLAAGTNLDPIVVKGSKFFYKTNGTEFFIKGVAYQAESTDSTAFFVDPLADKTTCQRDIPYLQELGTNTIRVYAVDPKKNHDDCMQLLQDAGIYVVSDLSEPQTSINRDSPIWDDDIYARYTAVVDALAPYSNVLGFFAGNEVSNQKNNTAASAYVKAAVRDTKAYIKQKKYRSIPVGYATNDDADIRLDLAKYFNCNSQDEGVDFWGYNIYSWCGDSSYTKSGYDVRTAEFANYSVPAFFAEYGCNQVEPRKFTDVKALYGDTMTKVWSGGIVYMYFEEANNYGLVKVSGNTVTKLADFDNLKKQILAVNPTGVQMNSYTPTNTKLQDCPAVGNDWRASSKLPPTPNQQLCSCMISSLGCVAKSSVDKSKYGDLFSFICGKGTDCTGINGNGTTGSYGAYSMCSPTERLSWAMNAYYEAQNKASTACDFNGNGQTQTPTSSSAACTTLLKEAGGVKGTGTVTSSPTSSGSSATSAVSIPNIQLGTFKIAAAMVVAFIGGFAMVII